MPKLSEQSQITSNLLIIFKALIGLIFSANVTISQGVLGDISLLADGNSSFFTTLMGVSGTMDIGTALVWGLVQVDQTPSWSTLESDQTTSYTTLTPSQTPSWEQQKA